MIRTPIQPALHWFKHVATKPREELDRWQYAARFAYELGVHGWKALNRDNAPQMAAALSFRTLFALLPVVVVSTLLVRAVRGEEGFHNLVQQLLMSGGTYDIAFGADAEGNLQTLGEWLDSLLGQAARLNLAALGWVGLAVVVYSAIGLLVTIENSFNAIYGAPEGRSWTRRIPTYWLLLTMSPVFIGVTLYLDSRFGGFISGMGGWMWLLTFAKVSWGFCVAWLFMFAVYRLVPNTKVGSHSALIGGFVAAAFLVIGKGSLGAYFKHAVSLESLYGSLGLIPLFMFWLYLMWLVVLFGLEVGATIQRVQGLHLEELQGLEQKRPQSGLIDPASVVSVMEIVSERFAAGRAATTRDIADEAVMPEALVCQMVERLAAEGFVHRVAAGDGAISLARPPEQIPADRLIEIGYSLVDEGGAARQSAFVQRLREAQTRLAHQATLASLLQLDGRERPGDQVAAD